MGSSRPIQASRRVFGRLSGPLEMLGEFPGVVMLSKAANVRTESRWGVVGGCCNSSSGSGTNSNIN